jgi:ADP-ribose pyrophosphatase YjhB (NUDIX family)
MTTLHDPDPATVPVTTDETLAECLARDDVETIDTDPEVHEGHFDVYAPIVGMAVVGVVDDAGRALLLVTPDGEHAMLPHARVDPDETFAAVAPRTVADTTGLDVTVTGVEHIREKSFRRTTDGDLATGYDVVFRATPTSAPPDSPTASVGDGDWTADWYDDVPIDPTDTNDFDVVADVRALVEN